MHVSQVVHDLDILCEPPSWLVQVCPYLACRQSVSTQVVTQIKWRCKSNCRKHCTLQDRPLRNLSSSIYWWMLNEGKCAFHHLLHKGWNVLRPRLLQSTEQEVGLWEWIWSSLNCINSSVCFMKVLILAEDCSRALKPNKETGHPFFSMTAKCK